MCLCGLLAAQVFTKVRAKARHTPGPDRLDQCEASGQTLLYYVM